MNNSTVFIFNNFNSANCKSGIVFVYIKCYDIFIKLTRIRFVILSKQNIFVIWCLRNWQVLYKFSFWWSFMCLGYCRIIFSWLKRVSFDLNWIFMFFIFFVIYFISIYFPFFSFNFCVKLMTRRLESVSVSLDNAANFYIPFRSGLLMFSRSLKGNDDFWLIYTCSCSLHLILLQNL